MRDIIYRDEAVALVSKPVCPTGESYYDYGREIEREAIKDSLIALQSADRPQGEWIKSFKPITVTVKREVYQVTKFIPDGWSCSVCSEYVEKRYSNCPYCLAKMKGAYNGNK